MQKKTYAIVVKSKSVNKKTFPIYFPKKESLKEKQNIYTKNQYISRTKSQKLYIPGPILKPKKKKISAYFQNFWNFQELLGKD